MSSTTKRFIPPRVKKKAAVPQARTPSNYLFFFLNLGMLRSVITAETFALDKLTEKKKEERSHRHFHLRSGFSGINEQSREDYARVRESESVSGFLEFRVIDAV